MLGVSREDHRPIICSDMIFRVFALARLTEWASNGALTPQGNKAPRGFLPLLYTLARRNPPNLLAPRNTVYL